MPELSVVIATHNRRGLLGRAIGSALSQLEISGAFEVIVVDDASSDGTFDYVVEHFPSVQIHRLPNQSGPGPARDLGIRMASGRWVVILDDDDELLPDALRIVSRRLGELTDPDRFPVCFFRHGNGRFGASFKVVRVSDLWSGLMVGDFLPVWQRGVALESYCYPETRVGAEALLWLEIADRHGIPTWSDLVGIVHSDAQDRLSGFDAQLRHAAEHALLQDRYVTFLKARPALRGLEASRIFASGVYHLLAGQRAVAFDRARSLATRRPTLAIALALACCVPRAVLVRVLREYRRLQGTPSAR